MLVVLSAENVAKRVHMNKLNAFVEATERRS